MDLKTKEEKDAELDRRIEALRKKNEALVKRYQVWSTNLYTEKKRTVITHTMSADAFQSKECNFIVTLLFTV